MSKNKTSNQPRDIIFRPASEAQAQFLKSDAWLTLYGGAAFAGKSMCLLGSMLPLIAYPGTRACVIRKTTKQLSGSGGLFDAAINLYSKVDPKLKIKMRDLTLVFSTGAEIQFTYLDKPADRMNLQGREYSRLCFDEGQQLTEDNVFYALSRLRSTRVDYPLKAVITCNPDPDSFLFNFVNYSLDDNLVPVRKEEYPKRFFCRTPQGILWYNTLQEAQKVHGTGEDSGIKSFLYIPGCIYDNPIGLEQNKDYIATLKALPDVERRRLLEGAWVRAQYSGFFKRDWVKMVGHANTVARNRVRAWDLAATLPSEVNPDPDWTVGSLVSKSRTGEYTIEDVRRVRDRTHKVEEFIFNTAIMDGEDVTICLPLDPGASGMAYTRDLQRRLSERGFSVITKRPDKSKLIRFKPFASIAEAGFVSVVRSDWNEMLFNELEAFDGSGRIHDDSVDSLSDTVWALNRQIDLPTFSLPDLTAANPLADLK